MSVLTDKYPALTSNSRKLFFSFTMSAFVFLFLSVFQPFGLNNSTNTLLICAGFGLTCLLVMLLLNMVVIPLLPGFFDENNWLVWKEIVWVTINVSVIGVANALYSSWAMDLPFTPYLFGMFQFYTVAVALLPIVLSILTNYSRLRNKYERYSKSLSGDIQTRTKEETKKLTSFSIASNSATIDLDLERFLYAKSSDNYVEIVYVDDDLLKREVLRKTLKSTVDDLDGIQDVFQVHRSFLVNLSKVSNFSGNAQGLRLHFDETDVVVPVSRNLTDALKKRLTTRH